MQLKYLLFVYTCMNTNMDHTELLPSKESNTDVVKQLINKKYNIINNIIHHKNKVASLKFDKNMIDLQIWDTCEHTWIRDRSAMFDDIHKYNCSKCSLYKSRRLYVI